MIEFRASLAAVCESAVKRAEGRCGGQLIVVGGSSCDVGAVDAGDGCARRDVIRSEGLQIDGAPPIARWCPAPLSRRWMDG